MTGRPSNRSSQTQAMPPAAARQNDYFVPRDGIDREVITSDICRYLGNDALVRPGTYESPDGRVTQGYFITAYRNLTSAMIQDLKADSARWEQERRAASRSTGAGGSREPRGQSDYSAWKNSLREQEYQASYGSAMDIDYAPPPGATGNPSYPTQAYQGVAQANYGTATYPPPIQGSTAQYPGQPAYTYTMNPPAVQYSPPPQNPSDRYSAIPPPAVPGTYGQDAAAAFVHGSNYQALPGFTAAGPARIPPPTMPHAAGAPSRTFSAPPAPAPVYGTDTDPYSYAQQPGNPAAAAAQAYPADPHYGRGAYAATTSKLPEAPSDDLGSPAGTTQQPRQGYPAPVDPQYDDLQANPGLQSATTPTAAAPAQMPPPPTGAPPARRDRDSEPREREREREHRDHRARRSEQERDDRHADRNRHRHRQ